MKKKVTWKRLMNIRKKSRLRKKLSKEEAEICLLDILRELERRNGQTQLSEWELPEEENE